MTLGNSQKTKVSHNLLGGPRLGRREQFRWLLAGLRTSVVPLPSAPLQLRSLLPRANPYPASSSLPELCLPATWETTHSDGFHSILMSRLLYLVLKFKKSINILSSFNKNLNLAGLCSDMIHVIFFSFSVCISFSITTTNKNSLISILVWKIFYSFI